MNIIDTKPFYDMLIGSEAGNNRVALVILFVILALLVERFSGVWKKRKNDARDG